MPLAPSGIYKITNTANGKVYIGQSENIFKRRQQHFGALVDGKHENKQMQKDWNECRGRNFRWDVVEYVPLKDLNAREKYWIDHYNSIEDGYNQGWVPYKRDVEKVVEHYKFKPAKYKRVKRKD